MPIGPGQGSSAARGRRTGRAITQAAVLISAMWLAIAALVGLIAALTGARRSNAPHSSPTADPEAGPAHPVLKGFGLLLVAVAAAAAAGGFYVYFNHEPVTANLTATTSGSLGQLVTLTDPGNGSEVQWSVTADARQLTVQGPSLGWAKVILPLPRSACQAMAAMLGGLTCSGGTIVSAYSPVVFRWTSPQQVQTVAGGEPATSFEVQSLGAAGGVPSVVTLAQGDTPPSLCFDPPGVVPVTLMVKLGPYLYRYPFTRRQYMGCGQGVTVMVGQPGAKPPEFELDGIQSLMLSASGPAGTLQGFTGQLMLTPGATTPLGSSSVVSVSSRGSQALTAVLQVAPGSRSLVVSSPTATSVKTGDSQLLPSEWAQHNDIFVPVLTSWVTAAVITPLGLALGVLTDALKRPSRRRNRRGRK